MKPATYPRDNPLAERLLHVDPRGDRFDDARVGDLARLLREGDLLVANDAATLPGALHGRTSAGAPIEIRLMQAIEDEGAAELFSALLFGAGDHRTRTEDRPPPPRLAEGETIELGPDLEATIARVWPASPRLVDIEFRERGARFWSALYRRGRPIQYAYVEAPLELWHTQTPYAGRPVCAEMPSAGRPLAWSLLFELDRRGVRIASVTHAAGLSSTGDPAIDALLPFPERYHIPERTARAVRDTRSAGGRVIAIGTTSARALEGAAAACGGALEPGAGITDLLLHRDFHPAIADGILTGMHTPAESHYHLLEAFAPPALLQRAHDHAERAGYLAHEFGDSTLILS